VKTKIALILLAFMMLALPAQARQQQTLTIFAASSLTDAFNEIGAAFQAQNPDVTVTFNFAGSTTLVAQLTDGAPADIFASANTKQMSAAFATGRMAPPPRVFAHNRLVLAVPADNLAHIQTLHDLANPGVLLVLAAANVPVRVYTDQMLTRLAADPAYGTDFQSAVQANIVSEEDNVRQVVAKLALGEADAGIVYRTDVTPDVADKVQMLPIPDAVNPLASYPIVTLKDSANPELARAFVDYILSADGQAILVKWGFDPAVLAATTPSS
jgi:molybdate transport system substrate-binding protein